MPRASGTPNRATAEKRAELLARIRARLQDRSAGPASWRELAAAEGVSLSSLTHHFGRRDDVVRALMEDERRHGEQPLSTMAQPAGDFATSIREAVRHLAGGLLHAGLDRVIATGLAEGLGHPTVGPAFVTSLLEPTIQAAEARLEAHVARGEMHGGATRLAAIELIAPLLVAVLHQRPLGGADVRPLDLGAFGEAHAESFIRSWAAATR